MGNQKWKAVIVEAALIVLKISGKDAKSKNNEYHYVSILRCIVASPHRGTYGKSANLFSRGHSYLDRDDINTLETL